MAAHMRTSLVTAALDMAIAARKPPAGVIFHSDRLSTEAGTVHFLRAARQQSHGGGGYMSTRCTDRRPA